MKVSVIIPGRCEPYFQNTVDSVLQSATGDIEVIAVVDGPGQNPPVVSSDPRVKVINLEKSIGQRGAYNLGVKESTGEYVMKIDAHALLSKGFDDALKAHCPEKTVVLPEMRRLNVHEWRPKLRGKTYFMHFGLDCYCHYWRDYRKRSEAKREYPEVMTGQGSCWFTSRKWNDYIGLLDERVGSWGNVGIEISLRTWLCGGSQIVNKKAWQAHWFRKDEGGFTYPMDGRQVAKAHRFTRENYYFNDNAFEHQERPFSWIIKKFSPVPGWEAYLVDEFKAPRVIVYYTDSNLDEPLASLVRKQILKACGPIPIISVSQKPLKFGRNIVVGEKLRCKQSMFEQMLEGLKAAPEDSIVYLCEHDVFYHPSHFAILPKDRKHAFFNTNRYHYRLGLDCFLKARGKRAYSQGVAYRDVWIKHIQTRIDECKAGKLLPMHIPFLNFTSDRPNVDIRHGQNLTPDGEYKIDWLNGLKEGRVVTETNLPGWGGVHHFGSRTGYRPTQVIPIKKYPNTDQFLRHKFRKSLPQPSPIRCIGFKRDGLAKIFNELEFKRGAEIGVREGVYSEQLCKSIKGLELFCIDIWEPYPGHKSKDLAKQHYAEAQSRLKPYNAHLMKMDNRIAAKDIADKSLDFVYIDAAHRFDNVMMDLITWVPKVRTGGIVAGHDYYRGRNNGVVPAVDSFTYSHQINEWYLTDEKEASFFWVKK